MRLHFNSVLQSWVLAWLAGVFSVITLFFLLPYATGYGYRPTSLFELNLAGWLSSPDWMHGLLVFPLAALMIFLKRRELAVVPIEGSMLGLPILIGSLLLFWFGYLINVQYVGDFALQCFVAGLAIWFLGVRYFSKVFFIWAFLAFAWPLSFLDQYVAFPLRLLMSVASSDFLNFLGVAALRDGTAVISAPNPVLGIVAGQQFSVDVADPCSGMHSLFALTMVSAIYGIISFRRWWQIAIVIIAALPLAVFGNFCRIIMLTFGTIQFGSRFAIGTEDNPSWFHSGAGFLVYLAALSGVLIVGALISRDWRLRSVQADRQ